MLELQQESLARQSAGVAGQAAIGADDAVAGQKDGQRVATDRAPERAHRAWPLPQCAGLEASWPQSASRITGRIIRRITLCGVLQATN